MVKKKKFRSFCLITVSRIIIWLDDFSNNFKCICLLMKCHVIIHYAKGPNACPTSVYC